MNEARIAPERGLRSLLIAQFLGAFNDNAWKLIVIVLAARGLAGLEPGQEEAAAQEQTMLAFVVFTLPLLLFSAPAGTLADRLSKRTVIIAMKVLELLLMAGGTLALLLFDDGACLLLTILGLMGLQSALFSPAKYGILPELVPHQRLSAANGSLESWTFLAIIAGTVLGPMLVDRSGTHLWLAGCVLLVLAAAGLFAARGIPRVPPARTEGGVRETVRGAVAAVRADRALWLAILGSAWFWAIASLLGQDMVVYSRSVLDLPEQWTGLPLGVFGVGVGLGAFLSGRFSGKNVETGLIPLGAVGLGLFSLLLGLLGPGLTGTCVLTGFLGVSSGFLIVPLDALIQWRAPADRRGGVIALANVLVFGGMLVGSLAGWLMATASLSSRGILVGAAVITVAGTAWALWLLPEAFLRLIAYLGTHTIYRLKVLGRENVPVSGGVLLAPNHVSFADGLFLMATIDRPIRFIIDQAFFSHPLLRPFLGVLKAIPISAQGGPRSVLRALRDAGRFLDEGEVVCIFPEGQITRIGGMLPFRRGMERIAKGRSAPVVPVHLDRVWGSIFSFSGGRAVRKLPETIPYPVTVSFGAPLKPTTPLADVREAVNDLGEQAWRERKHDRRPLHRSFIRSARRRPWRLLLSDQRRPRVSRSGALAGAIALARALRRAWRDEERVGILLPPSVAAALANVAAALMGKAYVNLNYTAGRAGMGSAAAQAGLRKVLTSREFVEKAGLEVPAELEPLWLEDIVADIGRAERLYCLLLALFAPARAIERCCGATRRITMDDVATVIFSSGSTGEPKGVLLTHFNLDSNIEGVAQSFRPEPRDRLLGILPLFHSFGNLATWFSLNHGLPMVFHHNPLDAPQVGRLVMEFRVTLMLATPTFLSLYLRRCTPEQFGSLRVVMAGAEKLSPALAERFEETFGIRPLEGYGATECAPVIAASVPSFRAPGFFQAGSRRTFVGQPLPGVSVRIVDPDTFEPLPPGAAGLLLVRGPNVMKGYLGRDDLTAEVMRDGWYVTGDMAFLGEDGFLKITDRLSRFSKIGGEMVPHGRVEEALHQAFGESGGQRFAVTAVPDEHKGERLAVLTTVGSERVPELLANLAEMGLPNLYIPRADSFVHVDEIPVLGTGKVDLKALGDIAARRLGRGG